MEYLKKNVIVLGIGKSGRACAAFLRDKGAEVSLYDDNVRCDGAEDIFCKRYDFAVISPGISPGNKAVTSLRQNGIPILSEPDLAYINCPSSHILAISGTNGKTTACTVLHQMLCRECKSHLVGNIGVPFVGEVGKIGKRDAVVLEISSFQIEQSTLFRSEIAALTNIGEDHLDRHMTPEAYRNIKLSLLNRSEKKVTNADDPNQDGIAATIRYSMLDESADFCLKNHQILSQGKSYPLPGVSRGVAYDLDYLCAFAVAANFCGIKKSFLSVYDQVQIPPYRNQPIGKLAGADVINDSKGTNIDATLFAASLLRHPAAIILGGSDKGEDYSRLMRGLQGVARLYLVGGNAREMYLSAEDSMRGRCRLMPDLESCVRDFVRDPLQVLLFSPASASFDLYKNYEERGKCFNEIVEKYRGY